MDVLAFRYARSGLGERGGSLADAAACPASDFHRDGALLALAARTDVTRASFRAAIATGELVVAHVIRGAIHAVAPQDLDGYGRALIARSDEELGAQLGRQAQRLGVALVPALAEVAEAIADAVAAAPLDRTALHAALRERVRPELMPYCKGCDSHHVAPMLWRYGTVAARVVLDPDRRYTPAAEKKGTGPSFSVERFLRFYGPATVGEFAEWAGVARSHARRLWDAVELAEVEGGWVVPEDAEAEAPDPEGVRLLPPGDPFLAKPNRALVARDPAVRKQLFRPVASPGAVLVDGRVAGFWRARGKEIAVEPLGRLPQAQLDAEVERVRAARA